MNTFNDLEPDGLILGVSEFATPGPKIPARDKLERPSVGV